MRNRILWAAAVYQEKQVPKLYFLFLSHYTAGPFKGQGRRHSHCLVANVRLSEREEREERALIEYLGQSSGVAGTDENFSLKFGEFFIISFDITNHIV